MNTNDRDKLKKQLSAIEAELNNQKSNLTTEERRELESLRAEILGTMFSGWLPASLARKSLMFLLFIVGLYGVVQIHIIFLLCWLVAVMFSPRLVAEITRAIAFFFKR